MPPPPFDPLSPGRRGIADPPWASTAKQAAPLKPALRRHLPAPKFPPASYGSAAFSRQKAVHVLPNFVQGGVRRRHLVPKQVKDMP